MVVAVHVGGWVSWRYVGEDVVWFFDWGFVSSDQRSVGWRIASGGGGVWLALPARRGRCCHFREQTR